MRAQEEKVGRRKAVAKQDESAAVIEGRSHLEVTKGEEGRRAREREVRLRRESQSECWTRSVSGCEGRELAYK